MFRTLDISTSALTAQRQRMNTIAGNIAQMNTTRNEAGEAAPYQRRYVTFQADTFERDSSEGAGVTFEVRTDHDTPPRREYVPGHPDADPQGYVSYPDIDMVTEFVNAIEAGRSYEANLAIIDMTRQMAESTLQILV